MIRVRDHHPVSQRLSDFLPWAAIVAPGVILQKDGIFQSTFEVRGYNFLAMSTDEIAILVASCNNMCMKLGSGWTLNVEARRVEFDAYPQSEWKNILAKQVDDERRNYYAQHKLYDMKYYVTFCYREPETKGTVRKFFSENSDDNLEVSLKTFQKYMKNFEGLLKECFLHVFLLSDNETVSYLHSCVSHNVQEVIAPPTSMYIDAYIADESLWCNPCLKLGDHYLGVISVHDFPHATRAHILEEMQTLSVPFRWHTRMIFIDEAQALYDIKKYRRKHYAQRKGLWKTIQEKNTGEEGLENTESVMKALDADAALELAGKGKVRFGYLTSVVVVSHKDIKSLEECVTKVKDVFQKKGFIVKEEQLNAMDAWLSSLPGQVYSNVRKFLVHSVNFSHMLPMFACWRGDFVNSHLKEISGEGAPHIIANMNSNVFYFNLNHKDVGHTLIVGPTGAGKSTLLAILGIQFLRYPQSQVIIFDKDYSSLPLTKKLDGVYYTPGSNESPFLFQPFRNIDVVHERQWGVFFCVQILEIHNVVVSGDVMEELKKSLLLLSGISKDRRTVSAFCKIVQNPVVVQVFKKYCDDEFYGNIFDGVVSENQHTPYWTMFEMGYLMKLGKDVVLPALSYLFHVIESKFDGTPTLLILDEGWLFLQHESFSDQFKVWLKTLRKKHVFVIMATQELADAIKSPLLETILSACATRIYLPDKSANQSYMKTLYMNFGLSEDEIALLVHAQAKKEYYITSHGGRSVICFDLQSHILSLLSQNKKVAYV